VSAPDHNVLITRAARTALRPLGCVQKGKSRTWLDDHHWWVTVIEFQPSAWSRGTYLNVGSCWLWYNKGHLSFDEGYRVESFQSAEDTEAFETAVAGVANRARDEAILFRQRFPTLRAVAEYLRGKETRQVDIWGHFNAGVSSGLAGWIPDSQRRFRAALDVEERDVQWVHDLKTECTRLLTLVEHTAAFREYISGVVRASRAALKLKARPDSVFSEL